MTALVLMSLAVAPAAFAAAKAAKPAPQPVHRSSVIAVIARSGVSEQTELRELVAFDEYASVDGWQAYAAQRAASRACHAERYATARDHVLSGRSGPLRGC